MTAPSSNAHPDAAGSAMGGPMVAKGSTSVIALLSQDRIWRNAEGRAGPIAKMSNDHAHNVLDWLRTRAVDLAQSRAIWLTAQAQRSTTAPEQGDEMLDWAQHMVEHPSQWLADTPLVLALEARVAATTRKRNWR